METAIVANPRAGPRLRGTGGLQKLRWARVFYLPAAHKQLRTILVQRTRRHWRDW